MTLFSSAAVSSVDVEINRPAPTTIRPQASRPPAFAAADEANDLREKHGPPSDDELWNHVDNNVEDDSVEVVSPDANKPAPLFSAVAALRPPPAETPSEASLRASPHYPEVVEKLRKVFHLKSFRKNQLAAIMSTLDGRDAIVLMPTGGGKSLCFQLPAVCRGGKTSGVTVVVTPLRALMADQVERLRGLNIDVMMLASMDSQDGNTMHQLRSAPRKPSLAYVTPEKLYCSDHMKAMLKDLHARQQLARFVIDEAHLINTWGRDFRSAGYAALNNLRIDYPGVPIVALTATATSEALQDIVTALGLSDYVLLSQSFNRPNLRYKVIPKKREIESSIIQFVKEKHPNETGIIYCISRNKTEEVAMRLKAQHLNARHFHAGLADADRKRIQQLWQNGDCKIIVATIAFGMGVDKADVRFVIHYDVPESVDAYCQETGRAGRDGEVADCILYYSYYDVQKRILQINKDTEIDEFQKDRKRQAVHTISQFCMNEIDCRRMLMLNHFTERFDPASCNGTCDNCASTDEVTELDLTTSAIQFVKMIQELDIRRMKITGALSIHAFRGTSKQEMMRRNFDTLDHFGKGSDISNDLAKRLFDNLVAREVLSTELEEALVPNRAPVSYVYVLTICLTPSMLPLTEREPCS
ncbi:P-loop containing nucleoside triphosphate hydrolase protein [Lactifluus subvellereus]|nr:P-loop containing nucleoside triphosphate hydrolase protein [Lactifluus subvellereus]